MRKRLTIDEINSSRSEGSKIIVIKHADSPRKGKTYVTCLCQCGKYFDIWVDHIRHGKGLSCGCLSKSLLNLNRTKYKNNNLSLNNIYLSMVNRCHNPNSDTYPNYGGRGVRVCEEWKNSYQSFLDWCLANGWKKGLQLDKDKLGDGFLYSPETCCFLTPKENGDIKWNMKRYEYNGFDMTLASIGRLHGIKAKTLRFRIKDNKRTLYDAVAMGEERSYKKRKTK